MTGITIGITRSVIGLQICAITAGIKKYKPIIKKRKKNHEKIVSKLNLNRTKVLLFKTLIHSNVSHDEFVLINDVLKEHEEIKKEMKNLKI